MKLHAVIARVNPTLIVMEDYAMGAGGRMNNNVFKIGELGGVLKTHFWENGFDLLPVAPTALKSAIALKGNADKNEIGRALAQRFGIKVMQHDEADAVGLLLVGEMRCGLQRDVFVGAKGKAQSERFESIQQINILKGKGKGLLKSIAKPGTTA